MTSSWSRDDPLGDYGASLFGVDDGDGKGGADIGSSNFSHRKLIVGLIVVILCFLRVVITNT